MEKAPDRPRIAAKAACVALLAAWEILLASGAGWRIEGSGPARLLVSIVVTWFWFNALVWMENGWRRSIVSSRGPLLGIGFAFAAALLSALVDGASAGALAGAGLFAARFVTLLVPFAAALIVRPGPYPHPVDVGVLAYALALPFLPWFGGAWASLPGVGAAGTVGAALQAAYPGALALGAGNLCAVGLIATYFYGARTWSAAPLDWTLREGDVRHALTSLAVGVAGFAAAAAALSLSGGAAWQEHLYSASRAWFGERPGWSSAAYALAATTAGSLLETLLFRSLLLAGLVRWLNSWTRAGRLRALRRLAGPAAAVAVAALHAGLGVYGLEGWPAFGFSLGLGLGYLRFNRFLPSALGAAGALFVLAVVGQVAG